MWLNWIHKFTNSFDLWRSTRFRKKTYHLVTINNTRLPFDHTKNHNYPSWPDTIHLYGASTIEKECVPPLQMTPAVKILMLDFSSLLQLRKYPPPPICYSSKEKKGLVILLKGISYGSVGYWGHFSLPNFAQTFAILVEPGSCCGVSCR